MAELGLAIAGFAFAVPGVVDVLFKYGEYISEMIKTFKNAKEEWQELDRFGSSLSKGELKGIILTAKSFYLEVGCDPGLKSSLEIQIQKLATHIRETHDFLKALTPDHFPARGLFAITGKHRAKGLNKILALDKDNLAQILTISDIGARRVPDQVLLTDRRFVHYQNVDYQAVPSSTTLFVTQGDYRDSPLEGAYSRTTVIIERSEEEEEPATASMLKEISALLFHRLGTQSSRKGILPCLGYRMQPVPELIFEMPKETRNPQLLYSLIARDSGVAQHALDFRFRLARSLAEAVLSVHAANLVHKSIRPNTILVLQPINPADTAPPHIGSGFGDVYLTCWHLLRETSGPSSQSGGTQWTEDIYRHPKRQGLIVEERYNIGHDIYSLGVCLLEIGLWDALIQTSVIGEPRVSDLFRAAANVKGEAPLNDEQLEAKINKPTQVKNILLQLADENLPQKMGIGYHRLVVSCLTGLDVPSGFGPDVDFLAMNKVEQGVVFKELVLSYVTELAI